MSKRLEVTLRRSVITSPKDQKETARSLGLTRINKTVRHPDNPAVRGMIFKIKHLVSVTEEEEQEA